MQKPKHHLHTTFKNLFFLIAAASLLTGALLLRRRRQSASTAINTEYLVIGAAGFLALVVLLGSGPWLKPAAPVSPPQHAAAPEKAVTATPLKAVPAESPRPADREADDSFKRLQFTTANAANSALLTVTDADGQRLEPDTGPPDYLVDPDDPQPLGFQYYKHLELAPLTMKVQGQWRGAYDLMLNNGLRAFTLDSIDTNAGLVDTIRQDGDTIRITFDPRHPRPTFNPVFANAETFTFSCEDATGSVKSLMVRQLPILPGATMTLTIDWQALQEDKAPLTIAVDKNSDGQPERTAAVGGNLSEQRMPAELELLPDTPEFQALFSVAETK